jgi:UDPglucose--hexose-1-phosphate uridylyltransferase
LTPPTLFSLPEGKDQWKVRVFSNLYPLVSADRSSDTYGTHEVIVETPEHDVQFQELPSSQILLVLQAIRERIKHLSRDENLVSFIAFRNQGLRGGASLVHPHTQLVGLSWIPPRLFGKLSAFAEHRGRGQCPLCSEKMIPRIIFEHDGFRAFSPQVPRFPKEVWIAPSRHESSYTNLSNYELSAMAAVLKTILQGLSQLFSPFDYNLVLYTKPRNDDSDTFHTHLEIIPRPEALAGFELGSGMFVNPQTTQQSILELRAWILEHT